MSTSYQQTANHDITSQRKNMCNKIDTLQLNRFTFLSYNRKNVFKRRAIRREKRIDELIKLNLKQR